VPYLGKGVYMYGITTNVVDWVFIILFAIIVVGSVVRNEIRYRRSIKENPHMKAMKILRDQNPRRF
jgi:hypothetical protein